MQIKDIRSLGEKELGVKIREVREELFRLKLKHRTNQLDSSSILRNTKKQIARLLTVVSERLHSTEGEQTTADAAAESETTGAVKVHAKKKSPAKKATAAKKRTVKAKSAKKAVKKKK